MPLSRSVLMRSSCVISAHTCMDTLYLSPTSHNNTHACTHTCAHARTHSHTHATNTANNTQELEERISKMLAHTAAWAHKTKGLL